MNTEVKGQETVYLFSFEELFLLFQSQGIFSVRGIYMEQGKVSGQRVLLILDKLASRGIIRAEEESFKLSESVWDILNCMAYPELDMELILDGEQYYYYERENRIVVTEIGKTKKKTLKVRVFEREEFLRWKREAEDDYR